MTRLVWDQDGDRLYEAGISNGVLYPQTGPGVPWNGLKTLNESSSGGELESYHYDGVKYLDVVQNEDYTASLEAYTYPEEFLPCEGILEIAPGMYATRQRREQFGLSYKTLVGNDIDGIGHGWKIHVVYNLTAAPSDKPHNTITDDSEPDTLSWDLSAVPVGAGGYKPTAHYIFDSREMEAEQIQDLEDLLYGTEDAAPGLPDIATLLGIVGGDAPVTHISVTAPTFTDIDGTEDDVIILPDVSHVIWRVNLVNMAPGTITAEDISGYPGMTVLAIPEDGYAIDGVDTWEFTFTTEAVPEFNLIWSDAYLDGPDPATFPRAPDTGSTDSTLTAVDGSHFGRMNTNVSGWAQVRGYAQVNCVAFATGSAAHAVEMEYDFSNTADELSKITAVVNGNWGNHLIVLSCDGSGAIALNGTATAHGSLSMTPVGGADLSDLPITGKYRVETNGSTISISIDDVVVATTSRTDDANPPWAGLPENAGFIIDAAGSNLSLESKWLAVRNAKIFDYS